MPVNPEKTVRVSVAMDIGTHHCVKALAIAERRSVAQWLSNAVQDRVDEELNGGQNTPSTPQAMEMELDELVKLLKSKGK